jgi:hypothetical protein
MSESKQYRLRALARLINKDSGEVYEVGTEFEIERTPQEISELVRLGVAEVVSDNATDAME